MIEDDSAEAVIQRMIETKRRFIREDNNDNDNNNTCSIQDGEEKEVESRGGIAPEGILIKNPAIKKHFQLEISTLQKAPRDVSRLEQILKAKVRENDKKLKALILSTLLV